MPEIVVLGTESTMHHISPMLEHFRERILIEPDWRPSVIAAHNPDLVITFEESQSERGLCIAEMAKHQIATLLMIDGIREWRNTWSRAQLPSERPTNQPIIAHKVACLGRADARLYESWGNVGKCEIVGAPRFDPLIERNIPIRIAPISDRPMRLLIMTAKTPGFTPEEIGITLTSLADTNDILYKREDIQVIWRATEGLHKQLGVKNTFDEAVGKELYEILEWVDAVITTPSTAMLEAMLFGLPVALLDYHNCPHYMPAAWRITCKNQITSVLDDLKNVPLNRMLYQEFCLHDALSCRTLSLPNAIKLIEEMIRIKRNRDVNDLEELTFPHRILNRPEEFVSWPSENFCLKELYPSHPVFTRQDLVTMQSELDAAIKTIDQLKEQVKFLENRLHGIPGYKLMTRIIKSFRKRISR